MDMDGVNSPIRMCVGEDGQAPVLSQELMLGTCPCTGNPHLLGVVQSCFGHKGAGSTAGSTFGRRFFGIGALFHFFKLFAILYLMKRQIKLNELTNFVKEFLNNLDDQNVFGLYGNLGSGKTTFVKEVAKQLGIEKEITSPTFTIMQSYEIDFKDFKKLVHIDLYRIEEEKEIEILNLEEIFEHKSSLVLIEWADKLSRLETRDLRVGKIEFDYNDENSRIIEIQNG